MGLEAFLEFFNSLLSAECIEALHAYLKLSEKVRNSVDIIFDQMCDRSDQKDFRIAA
ncbi:hypothetical protein AGMMS50289_17210 [Betaproteobacteria bacterium]|nr:hypothetical protein AGMMS50289_17210 [Betaproteobacteria bacterium]